MEQENKKKDNTGCAIAVEIFVLVNIVYYFLTTSKADIANTGVFILFIAFAVGAFLGIKAYLNYTSDTDNKFVRIGVPIGIVISLLILFGSIMNNFNAMFVIGSIGFMAFCILIGILIYNSNKD